MLFLYGQGSLLNLSNGKVCGINGSYNITNIPIQSPENKGLKMCEDIMIHVPFPLNFTLYATKQSGTKAIAFVDESMETTNNRFIVYNPLFLQQKGEKGSEFWISLFLFAHEIGHHAANHVFSEIDNRKNEELAADYFAGYILGRMGANRYEMSYINNIFDIQPTTEYPSQHERFEKAISGWEQAKSADDTNPCTKTTTEVAIYNNTLKKIRIKEIVTPEGYRLNESNGYKFLPLINARSEERIPNLKKGTYAINYSVALDGMWSEQAVSTQTFYVDPCKPENKIVINP